MSKHFSEKELTCRCGCGDVGMDETFMALLERIRVAYGRPMNLSSAKRCKAHNKAEGGGELSAHLEGRAVDVYVMGADAMALVNVALYCGATGLGIDQRGDHRFIHIDNAQPVIDGGNVLRPRPWLWSY